MLTVKTFPVTEFQQNCRILWQSGHPSALVVDPGGDGDRIIQFLQRENLTCSEIWLTHSHLDHCGGVACLLKQYPVALLGHPIEREFRLRVNDVKAMYGIVSSSMENCPEPTRYLEGGEEVEFQGTKFSVLFTPGHSPGHLCFYAAEEKFLLAGDTLFAGSIGRTDLPGGDFKTLKKSIVEKILTLPDDTRVLSGHGQDTLVGTERRTNPFITGDYDE
jgi:hydroxyacylglutathione hydrolase